MKTDWLAEFLKVSVTAPDDERRTRMLNILLMSVTAVSLLVLLITFITQTAGAISREDAVEIYWPTVIVLVGIGVTYIINHYGSNLAASSLFLLLLTGAVYLYSDPYEFVWGSNGLVLALPIFIASVILHSRASFVVAGVIIGLSFYTSAVQSIEINYIGNLTYFTIAFVAWFSSRNLRHAIQTLHTLIQELDQRMMEQTRELFDMLAREHAEASQNQAILESIADGVIVFNHQNEAIVANPAISHLLEVTVNEITGCNIQTLMEGNVPSVEMEVISGFLEDKELRRPPMKLSWGDKTLSVSFAPIRDTPTGGGGTVAVFRDFTREAEIDQMKNDFVSIASHELRSPLTSIKGYLDLLLKGVAGAINEQQANLIRVVTNNADRLNELVGDLLDVSRIESGKIDLKIEVASLSDLITQVAGDVQKQFDDRRLTLTLDIPPDVPYVLVDPGRVTQILFNLLSNVYKYTDEGGGTVRIRPKGRYLQIDVIDTGLGISEEDQEKLFTRFFRAESKAVRKQPGTGLGLSITRSLVEMHGGEISVESQLGVGTTIHFTLPLPEGMLPSIPEEIDDEETAESLDPAPTQSSDSPASVLVVDDDPETAELFRYHLEQAGYQVTTVTQSRDVVKMARKLKPGLITLDLLMEVDGLTILDELKHEPDTANIPVVIVSVIQKSEQCLALGAADYLTKPVEKSYLLDSIRQILGPARKKSQPKILVVEDDQDIAEWLKQVLTFQGYEVGKAYDGIQALEQVEIDRPDLILLDLMMPRMDGRTTIRHLRQQEESQNIPIVVLSAYPPSDPGERAQMLGAGVREFLEKPTSIDRLVTEVQKHIMPG